jgi:hypothetical protein
MARWLREQGIDAQALATEFVGETAEVEAAEEEQSESP